MSTNIKNIANITARKEKKLSGFSVSAFDGSALPLDKKGQLNTSTPEQVLQKRAKRNYFGRSVKYSLLKYNEKSILKKQYFGSLLCVSELVATGDKITGKYCKARWCPVCNAIKTANYITAYKDELLAFKEPRLLTLTIPNMPASELKAAISGMGKVWRSFMVKNTLAARRKGLIYEFSGLRKLEVTYNKQQNNYHPHYHIMCNSQAEGERLINYWLQKFPKANRKAQNNKPMFGGINGLLEVFKYATKLTSSMGDEKQSPGVYAKAKFIDYKALNNIFIALRNIRIFQPFGNITKLVNEDEISEATEATDNVIESVYKWQFNDWHEVNTNTPLSNYQPTEADMKFNDFLAGKIKVINDLASIEAEIYRADNMKVKKKLPLKMHPFNKNFGVIVYKPDLSNLVYIRKTNEQRCYPPIFKIKNTAYYKQDALAWLTYPIQRPVNCINLVFQLKKY